MRIYYFSLNRIKRRLAGPAAVTLLLAVVAVIAVVALSVPGPRPARSPADHGLLARVLGWLSGYYRAGFEP